MKNVIILFFLAAFFVLNIHCNQDEKNSLSKKLNSDSISVQEVDTSHNLIGDIVLTWVDTIVINYIKNTRNELITLAKKDTSRLEWYKDVELRNGVKYIVVEIGSTFKHRFIPRSWLYIDSATRKVYENDIANDTLIKPR